MYIWFMLKFYIAKYLYMYIIMRENCRDFYVPLIDM